MKTESNDTIHIGPSRDEMLAMIQRRKIEAKYAQGEGYWAKQAARELDHAGDGYYTVEIGGLGRQSDRRPGVIYRRPATSGKWGKSAATRLGPPVSPCIDLTPRRLDVLYMDGAEISVSAPRSYSFGNDAKYGIHLRRDRDGETWHFAPAAAREPKKLIADMRSTLSLRDSVKKQERIRAVQSRKWSAEQKIRAKESARIEAIFARELATVRVTMDDSRRAGNCIEGSLVFAERKLGIDRESVLKSRHLFSVPAPVLLRHSNEDKPRVNAAIRQAWMRETTVCI
jgi:hypothetical protein